MQITETGETVRRRTYARPKPDGSLETWPETVERVVDGNIALVDDPKLIENEREDLIRMMTEFKIIPAGRHLWASGVQGATHLMNCWASGWTSDPTEHFEFSFMRLMEGGGVGANYSNVPDYALRKSYNVHVVCSPEHPDYDDMKDAGLLSDEYCSEWVGSFEVEDSREGWADAVVDLIGTYFRDDVKNKNRVYDVSNVRAAGARLKTFGGTASGPAPLAKALKAISDVLNTRDRLSGMAAMEIDHALAECVVSGGVRRSARMAMMHWEDPEIFEFINCKKTGIGHWSTNISVVVDEEFWLAVRGDLSCPATTEHAGRVLDAISEGTLRNGEPGFWDISLSQKGEPGKLEVTNPCLTGDTVIATVNGPRTFADLAEAGEDVEVYSWHPKTKTPVIRWMRKPRKTRENAELLKITFDSGLVVRCTPDHSFYTFRGKKTKAKNLKVGSSIRAFSASYDGSGHERIHGWDSERNAASHQWTHRMLWENTHGPIDEGMVIAHLDGDAYNNTIENLAMMTPYEHASYDYPKRLENGFHNRKKEEHPANHKIVSIEPGGYADVYNGTVDDSHTYVVLDPSPVAGHMSGIISANCGEITLEAWEPCNLGHVNLAAFVDENGYADYADLALAHHLMTRFLIRATFAPVGDLKSRKVLDRNRRIGVGHLGVASFLAMTGQKYSDAPKSALFEEDLFLWKCSVDYAAEQYSHDLRIPVPVKKRTVAPTGTIAKMPGVSEGVHPIFSKYFLRRIRFSTVDPDQIRQVEEYKSKGYNVVDDIYADNTVVVEIPTKDILVDAVEARGFTEDVVEGADELTLQQMLDFQAMYQTYWADNAVSYTANVRAEDYTVETMREILLSYGGLLKGSTIFPEATMALAPYERMAREQYEYSIIQDVGDGVDEECAGGKGCPVR